MFEPRRANQIGKVRLSPVIAAATGVIPAFPTTNTAHTAVQQVLALSALPVCIRAGTCSNGGMATVIGFLIPAPECIWERGLSYGDGEREGHQARPEA